MTIENKFVSAPRLVAAIASIALLASAGTVHAGFSEEDDDYRPPEPDTEFTLKVVERKSKFDRQYLRVGNCASECTVKITVIVPKSAKHKHGIGIDGGDYDNVEGVAVAPGRRSSLTITLRPGKYVVYDSYKKNRKKPGYRVRLTVE